MLGKDRFKQRWKATLEGKKIGKHTVEVQVVDPEQEEPIDKFTYRVEFDGISSRQLGYLTSALMLFTQDDPIHAKDNAGTEASDRGEPSTSSTSSAG